ncbi:MAG: transglutaminase domain-containing protein [Bdellovibrionales bacterium]|nr:transglutaminase domain-containing protein [Bdellovibrionales bacterium]
MFQARLRGNCTMTATLQATVLKALGIPTRLVGTVLPLDPNDADQIQLFSEQVHHNEIRRQVTDKMKTSKGWVNHTFNEVFIGGRWIRLNYNILGQPPIWSTMGMMVQIFVLQTGAIRNLHLGLNRLTALSEILIHPPPTCIAF